MTGQSCTKCGQLNSSEARFCINCGSPMPAEGETEPSQAQGPATDLVKNIVEGTPSGLFDLFERNTISGETPLPMPTDIKNPFAPPENKLETNTHPAVNPPPDNNSTMEMVVPVMDAYCPFCKGEIGIVDKFCRNCGRLLDQSFEKCRNCATPLVPDARYCFHCGVKVEPLPELLLEIIENHSEYRVPRSANQVMVGRTVPQQDIFVDLDLGPYGQRRVSRQHARFILKDNKWYLEDMDSKAGTRIYNTKAEPYVPVLIEDGMVIYFADIKVKVHLA